MGYKHHAIDIARAKGALSAPNFLLRSFRTSMEVRESAAGRVLHGRHPGKGAWTGPAGYHSHRTRWRQLRSCRSGSSRGNAQRGGLTLGWAKWCMTICVERTKNGLHQTDGTVAPVKRRHAASTLRRRSRRIGSPIRR